MSDQFERVNRAIIDRSIDEFSYAYLQIHVFQKKKKKGTKNSSKLYRSNVREFKYRSLVFTLLTIRKDSLCEMIADCNLRVRLV